MNEYISDSPFITKEELELLRKDLDDQNQQIDLVYNKYKEENEKLYEQNKDLHKLINDLTKKNSQLKDEMNIKIMKMENKIMPVDADLQQKVFEYQNKNNNYIDNINTLKYKIKYSYFYYRKEINDLNDTIKKLQDENNKIITEKEKIDIEMKKSQYFVNQKVQEYEEQITNIYTHYAEYIYIYLFIEFKNRIRKYKEQLKKNNYMKKQIQIMVY